MLDYLYSRYKTSWTTATAILAIGLLVFSGCSPTTANRGNLVEDFRLDEVLIGISSRSDVIRHIGSPTTQSPFDENIWYYMGQKTEKHSVFDPQVVEEKIVMVAFDNKGIVQKIEHIDNGRINVPLVERETPTSGNDFTVMQQIIGNIGRFNKPLSDSDER